MKVDLRQKDFGDAGIYDEADGVGLNPFNGNPKLRHNALYNTPNNEWKPSLQNEKL